MPSADSGYSVWMQLPGELRDWPFAPGDSSFQVKGIAYSFHQEYVRDQLPGGLVAQYEAMRSDALTEFFQQTFYATGMYDVYPLVIAGYACAEVTQQAPTAFLEQRTKHQVGLDLGLIRRTVARIVSARYLAKRFTQITSSYLNFIETEFREVQEGVIEGAFCGMPEAFLQWHTCVSGTFLCELLRRGGTSSVELSWHAPQPYGQAHQLPVFSTPYTLRWNHPADQ